MPRIRSICSALVLALAIALSGASPAAADHHLTDGTSVNLIAFHSDKCADVISASTADGAEIAQYDCNDGLNQLWRMNDLGDGYVELTARHSDKCLDVTSASDSNGAKVIQWTCNGGANQQWQIQDAGNGQVQLIARHSDKCLDVPSSSTDNGARLQQWDCHTGDNQKWELNLVSNPALPGLFADPNIVVFDDTYYLYPTTDGFAGWSGTQYRAFSSTDLVNWTDHGVILDLATDVSWADNSAWAPGIAEKNGKYYFYFSGGLASGNTAKHLGVAVSDSPTGPFTDALGEPLVPAGTYSGQAIDPAVYTDDDGQSYLYWGNGQAQQVPLNEDMISFDPDQVAIYDPPGYNEGAFVVERDGTYYFMWSENDTRSEDYRVAYATGSSPTGPWSDRVGVILQKDLSQGIKGTGHHSVVQVPGTDDWYIAYHRFAIPDGDGTHRETMIDRLYFEPDGSIRPVVPTLEGIAPI
ncbi:family 43 glycosylhydrolase [Glycomyces sp. L485]|uniref:family 43 glycosylhydrolase n=1 Tax=Glycomyces sp. L485 TaxID=2909235 RepID=UPI001F4B3600|nr:family 43 glycosylhydrolase [Glycomyces sp. L485]MCH7229438.1 family 43 glycosylhydrolase [Glycomyces sp. L485]